MSHTKITILTNSTEEKEILLALLSDAGFEGFEEEHRTLSAFTPEQNFNENALRKILESYGLSYTKETIPETNWNAEWEKDFVPVMVNRFCCIRAAFHLPVENVEHDIIITPRMSFGTGHHATTWLVISKMEKLDFRETDVLDYGTGTGVLAILAEKLGASKIVAIDNDKWSIENAADNFKENECLNIKLVSSGVIETRQKFRIILANINRNVLLDQMGSLAQHLAKDGVLLMSGLLTGDRPVIEEKANANGLIITGTTERDGWIVLELIHK